MAHSGASRGSRSEWTEESVTRSSERSRQVVCSVSEATGSDKHPKGRLFSCTKSVSPDKEKRSRSGGSMHQAWLAQSSRRKLSLMETLAGAGSVGRGLLSRFLNTSRRPARCEAWVGRLLRLT